MVLSEVVSARRGCGEESGCSVAAAAAGAAGCAGGRSARVGCGRLGGSAAAVLEVGGIPATALELEVGCRDLLDVACRTASGAGGQWRITHLLDVFLLSATGSTAIFVD